ncbi:hypothetical protein Leryth_005133 [Lithospermum erythrorhizon]|nr:hypothetical protein Leryth_005133 [Lithospermum erythrorhizon]
MALVKEIMGASLMEKSSFVSTSSSFINHNSRTQLRVNPVLFPLGSRRFLQPNKGVGKIKNSPVLAAISENLTIKVVPEKAVKFKVRAIVTVKNKNKEDMKETILKQLDAFTDKMGRNVVLQLVSSDIDPKTKGPKKSSRAVLKDWSKKSNAKTERVNYTAEFEVDSNFGTPGAITVVNKHQQEFFLESITLEEFACGPIHFPCNSWVQNTRDHPTERIFFSNKVCSKL